MKQKPAFFINLITPPGTFDVNISPDKREIILTHEELIMERLKEAVDVLYESSRYTFQVNNTQSDSATQIQRSMNEFPFILRTVESSTRRFDADIAIPVLNEVRDASSPMKIADQGPHDEADLINVMVSDATKEGNEGSSHLQDAVDDAVKECIENGSSGASILTTSNDKDFPEVDISLQFGNNSTRLIGTTPIASVFPTGDEDLMIQAGVIDTAKDDVGQRGSKRRLPINKTRLQWDFDSDSVLQRLKCKRDFIDTRVNSILKDQSAPDWASSRSVGRVSAREGEEGIRVLCKEVQ